jgi:hypothetical protein
MILLSYGSDMVREFIETGERFDGEFVDYLDEIGIARVDSLAKAAGDYKAFNLKIDDYLERFYIGRAGAQVFGRLALRRNGRPPGALCQSGLAPQDRLDGAPLFAPRFVSRQP